MAGERPEDRVQRRSRLAEKVPGGVVGGRGLRNLILGLGLQRVEEIGKLDGILYEEDGGIVPDNVKVAFVGVAIYSVSFTTFAAAVKLQSYKRVANPWISRTVSALPRDPRTVEKRTSMGVFLSLAPRNDAAVMLLKSP